MVDGGGGKCVGTSCHLDRERVASAHRAQMHCTEAYCPYRGAMFRALGGPPQPLTWLCASPASVMTPAVSCPIHSAPPRCLLRPGCCGCFRVAEESLRRTARICTPNHQTHR
jgi:nitrite reductase/ring-hydroxylating ferredoxin subunit